MNSLLNHKNTLIVFLFFILTCAFFYQVFLGKIPLPADTLVGAYYPWLDYKWGFPTGVPVKNPILSDVFSQYYPWRDLVISIFKQGSIPLWNPYSFAGTPLLADWQSAFFYPPNILMLLLGNIRGWTAIIMLQPFLSMVFTYLYLQEVKLNKLASSLGAIIYAFSGFSIIFLEYNSPAQAAIWLPLILFLTEKYLTQKRPLWLGFISLTIFFLLTAGNFQVSLYSLILVTFYLAVRAISIYRKLKPSLLVFLTGELFYLLGIGLAALQILPTFELFQNSIRQGDQNIVMYNFGLLPLQNILTFFAPDFFGNPVTYNFWGFIYQETTGYFGIIAWPLIITAVMRRKDFITTFFGFIILISLLLIFDTAIGKLVYQLKIPLLSTSYASRALFLLDFSAAVLAAKGLNIFTTARKTTFKATLTVWMIITILTLGIILITQVIKQQLPGLDENTIPHLSVSLRNLFLPLGLITIFLFSLKMISNIKIVTVIIFLLVIFDQFRFGLKYTPFIPQTFLYPPTPALEFLQQDVEFFRVEREKSESLPPNTWIPYRLMSPSGYNPLYSKQYAAFYNVYNTNPPQDTFTRYAELSNYNSPFLDLAGVKYLMSVKRKPNGSIDSYEGTISPKIGSKFKKVFEDQSTVILENTHVLPRAQIMGEYEVESDYLKALTKLYQGYDFSKKVILSEQPSKDRYKLTTGDQAQIVHYLPNEVNIQTSTKNGGILLLTDSYYPGWKVSINGLPQKLFIADGVFRAVELPTGESLVQFKFEPGSFKYGLWTSLASLIVLVVIMNYTGKKLRFRD